MTDSLARRQTSTSPAVRPFGELPAAQTGLQIDRALELAGVDPTEFALLASTTFKEARTLEELVTLIATTRRRGLDGMARQIYYERFGGQNSDPSMHVGIDGLRAIAAATGEYAGSSEARYSGAWDMPIDDTAKPRTQEVPERCTVTVWRLVKGRACAFEGAAWMSESYPGPGGRGRMWRARPRGMLSIAAERQALRKAFPSETSGIGDHDDTVDPESPPAPALPTRTVGENAATYDKIFSADDEPKPAKRERPLDDLIELYDARLKEAVHMGWVPRGSAEGYWQLPKNPTRDDVLEFGAELKKAVERAKRVDPETGEVLESEPDQPSAQEGSPERPVAAADPTSSPPTPRPDNVTMRSALGQKLADLVEDAARLEVEFDDCRVEFPAPREQVIRAIEKLEDRTQAKKDKLAGTIVEAEPVAAAQLI